MRDAPEPEVLLDAAERACQKLCARVARLVTTAGSEALLARALSLATIEFPFLAGVQPSPMADRCLQGLHARVEEVEPAVMRDAATAVLAGIIMLLCSFIGQDLTLGLVRDIWPDVPTDEGLWGVQEMLA